MSTQSLHLAVTSRLSPDFVAAAYVSVIGLLLSFVAMQAFGSDFGALMPTG